MNDHSSREFLIVIWFIVFFISSSIYMGLFQQKVFGIQDDLLVLKTGIISTKNLDYAISNIFETRILQDGKIMRISGITTTGEAYYIYQRVEDGITELNGKILIHGEFIPIINKEITSKSEIQIKPNTKLNVAVKLPTYTYSSYPFNIAVKVFDAEKNPQANFEERFGTIENVFVNVTISNRFDNFVTSISGYTDSSGLFQGSYLVNDRITGQGEFKVNVIADDGKTSTSKSYTTFFRGDIRYYFDK